MGRDELTIIQELFPRVRAAAYMSINDYMAIANKGIHLNDHKDIEIRPQQFFLYNKKGANSNWVDGDFPVRVELLIKHLPKRYYKHPWKPRPKTKTKTKIKTT
jgi:hypothetical protein